MNIDKAIEIKEKAYEKYCVGMLLEEREADRLSIEALKRIQHIEALTAYEIQLPLPGETK